jgi:hypothetical protein
VSANPRAFPDPSCGADRGMTLRDYFAGQALAGLCANNSVIAYNPNCGFSIVNTDQDGIAALAASLADAMLKTRGEQ